MARLDIEELSREELQKKKKTQIYRLLFTVIVIPLFTIYIVYLDLVKETPYDYIQTYIFIAVGFVLVAGENFYKIRKLNQEIKKRNQ